MSNPASTAKTKPAQGQAPSRERIRKQTAPSFRLSSSRSQPQRAMRSGMEPPSVISDLEYESDSVPNQPRTMGMCGNEATVYECFCNPTSRAARFKKATCGIDGDHLGLDPATKYQLLSSHRPSARLNMSTSTRPMRS